MEKPGSRPTSELVRLAIIGDGAAFTELWDTHIEALEAYIRSTMKGLDDFYVDDICSRSFEKAFRQIRSYDPSKSQFSTWLRTIAHNTALDILEQEQKARRSFVYLDDSSRGPGMAEAMGDGQDTPLEQIIRDEDQALTEKYITALPDLYREIARRRLVDGLQYKEIAEEMDMELNTVRTRIRRAKAIIEQLKENDNG